MILRFGEIFCGAGGLSLGALRARATGPDGKTWKLVPVWAIDSDPDACATYRLGIHGDDPAADVRCADIRHVDATSLEPIDILFFGFPCNDFSTIGKRLGMRGAHGPLYLEAVRILRGLRPLAFVAENVSGLRSAHGGRALRQVAHDLTRSGYRVAAHLFRLEHYGVPQARHRIFLVGIRRDMRKTFRPPAPTTPVPITAGQALRQPFSGPCWNDEPSVAAALTVERLRHIRPGETIWDAQARPGFPEHLRLNVPPQQQFRGLYRRLDPDRPAWTIVARGGGGSKGFHWCEDRPLTNRERARLQGFPDEFRFLGTQSSVRSQIGMAVPPPAAEAIASAVLATLAGIAYPSVEPNIRLRPERRTRGRPRRLETKTDADRARNYRVRRVTENRVAARALARALRAGILSGFPVEERALLVRFIERNLGAGAAEMPLAVAAE